MISRLRLLEDRSHTLISECKRRGIGSVQIEAAREFLASTIPAGRLVTYKQFPLKSYQILDASATWDGEHSKRIFLLLALAVGVIDTIRSPRFRKLPEIIQSNQLTHFERVVSMEDFEGEWLTLDNDLYQKDLGLVTLRLYASGAQLIDYSCGISRSIIAREGLWKAPRNLYYFLRVGGFKPFFQIHTHKSDLSKFDESGWEACYHGCAALYETHPDALGMFGASWFYDPVLEDISPRLSYLRRTPSDGGAEIFFYQEGGDAIGNALSTSSTRRNLYDQGSYMPKSYFLVWGKNEQMAWSRSHS